MEILAGYGGWILAMLVLICFSGFFSASEAALFSLTLQERRKLERGSRTQKLAAALIAASENLLTAVLFWNLLINMLYFAIASMIEQRLITNHQPGYASAVFFLSLLGIIIFGEMLPKSFAVSQKFMLATLLSVPLTLAVKLVSRLIPIFRFFNRMALRLLWPGFEEEHYLSIEDLDRAVDQSTTDDSLKQQEHRVLHHLLDLSEIRVDELMQPRSRLETHHPPVSWDVIGEELPHGGYLLITEPESEEIVSVISLLHLKKFPKDHLEKIATPVIYIPWCAPASEAIEQISLDSATVIAVVNEHGETIGILTFEDLMDTIIGESPSRSARLLKQKPISQVGENRWRVTGITSLRGLVEYFQMEKADAKSNTVSGLIQELLGRLPEPADVCEWEGFTLKVLEVGARGRLIVEFNKGPTEVTE